MNNTSAIILLVILTLVSAFFSSAETGMMALNRYRLKHMVKKGNTSAKRVSELLAKPDKLLSTILIGNTFANLLYSSIFTQLAISNFGELSLFESLMLTIVASLLIMVFAESTPKTFAALHPQTIAFPFSYLLKYLLIVLYPLVWLITFIGNSILKLFGVKIPSYLKHHDPLSHEELRTLVYDSREQFPAKNTTMLIRLLDLNYSTVEDIMIPRSEVQALDITSDWKTIQQKIIHWPHTYILFYESELDNVLGFIHVKTILKLLNKQQLNKDNLQNHIEDCYFIPQSTTLANQLLNFQNNHKKSSLVVDEYGEIMGLITLQDILEEVVGEFDQAHTQNQQEIRIQTDGTVFIDGSTYIRDINRELNWHLPEDGPKTISGLIIETLETIPESPIGVIIDNYKIEVLSLHRNTIKIVKVYI